MTANLELEKENIEKKRQKLLLQQRLIKEKQKKMQLQRLAKIGKLANKAQIDELDDETLLGAFLEISEQLGQQEKKKHWKQIALNFLENSSSEAVDALIISFNAKPEKQVLDLLQGLKFRFNKFRNEYYGHANKKSLEKELDGSDCNIEVFED